jgi:hypothetical protein
MSSPDSVRSVVKMIVKTFRDTGELDPFKLLELRYIRHGRIGAIDLRAWRDSVCPGAAIIYHRGALVFDRSRDPNVDSIARAALDLHAKGLVTLMQKRLGSSLYEYSATARNPTVIALPPVSPPTVP